MTRADEKTIACVRRLYARKATVSTIMEMTGLSRRQVDYHTRDMPHPGQGWAKKWDCTGCPHSSEHSLAS